MTGSGAALGTIRTSSSPASVSMRIASVLQLTKQTKLCCVSRAMASIASATSDRRSVVLGVRESFIMPDLTRWQGLAKRAPGLWPKGLAYTTLPPSAVELSGWHVYGNRLSDSYAADLIHMSAIRWLEEEDQAALYFLWYGPIRSPLDDRLFAAVQKAMEGKDE